MAHIIGIPNKSKPPIVRVKWIAFWELLTLPSQIEDFLPMALLAIVLLAHA